MRHESLMRKSDAERVYKFIRSRSYQERQSEGLFSACKKLAELKRVIGMWAKHRASNESKD